MAKINPNSSIRSGYRYEDLHVLQLCADWLYEPDKYNNIKIQYTPDGVKGFAMDDVVVEHSNGRSTFYQLKYKQNPQVDKWNFQQLLKKGLLKWIWSFKMLGDQHGNNFSLISNGIPDSDVESCLQDSKIDWEILKDKFPEFRQKLKDTFNDEDLLEGFFENFEFRFNQLDKNTLEDEIRRNLYDELKVTKAGVDSLLLYIAVQGSEKYPKLLTLNDIRKYLAWDNPRPLNQSFKIPADFVFFNQNKHRSLLSELKNVKGGTKLFIGKPGAGKSTYLSKLHEILVSEKIAVFRHHYHLNPKDDSQFERLNTERVKEALRAAFKNEKSKVLEELSWENTANVSLKEFISKIAAYYSKLNKSFILIVDGLDHVIREGKSEEQLREFLNEIYYPQTGYWLLLGTQEMAIPALPNTILRDCPEHKWIEIKGLKRPSVAKIVKASFNRGKNQITVDFEKEIVTKVFDKTKGNPLHLRYVIEEIINSNQILSLYNIDRIPPYKGEIKNYYEDMWRNLSDLAKTFCFAITILDFKLHKEQLFQLGSYFTRYSAEISSSFREIKHLLVFELSGISVYHNSFLVFMKDQPELIEQQFSLYRNLRIWLDDYDNEDLRWAELAKIEYFLGNPIPLLNLDKEWLISSYLQCRDEYQIQNLLELATDAAFKLKDYKKVIFYNTVSSKFRNRSYNLWDENLKKIWVTAFKSNHKSTIKYPEFSHLTHYQIKELLIALKDRGMISEIPEAAFDRINFLFHDRDVETDDLSKAWIEIMLNFDDASETRVIKFIKQFRKEEQSQFYFRFYVFKILENYDQFGHKLSILFRHKLTDQEKKSISSLLIHDDLKNGRFKWKKLLNSYPRTDNFLSELYNFLENGNLLPIISLKNRNEFLEEYKYVSEGENNKKIFLDHFNTAVLLTLKGNTTEIQQWLNSVDDSKLSQLLKAILLIAQALTESFLSKERINVIYVLEPLNNVTELDFYKDHSIFELRRSVIPNIIDQVLWLAHIFNMNNHIDPEIKQEEIKLLSSHSWYYQSHLFDVLHSKMSKLSEDAFHFFAEQEVAKLDNELSEFKDKTERMVNLAILAAEANHSKSLDLLLYRAAENLTAYGNHKDMLLYDVLSGLEILIKSGSKKAKEFLRKISPYVYNIDKLTDGDETGSFIYDYSSQLAKIDVPALLNFYLLSLEKRDYYLSESLFSDILKTLDFSHPIGRAIGNTSVDRNSNIELTKLSKLNIHAKRILENIQSSLGPINYEHKPYETHYSGVKAKTYSIDELKMITPDNLKDYLQNSNEGTILSKYNMSSIILTWMRYQFEEGDFNQTEIINVVKEIIDNDYHEVDDKLLDYLYPYAKKVDNEFAFKCICWAHSNSGSWASDFFSEPEQARDRWMQVIKDFPKRLDEFFKTSINNSGAKYSKTSSKNYTFSAPKVIQYFTDSEGVKYSEEIFQHYIELLPVLFPNVNLPEPEFYRINKKIELFDILLTRFEWISPLVKERAGKELINLLINDQKGHYHQKYFLWLNSLQLESKACEGLMLLLISVQDQNSYTRAFITSENLGELLNIRCMATDLITDAIGSELKIDFKFGQILCAKMSFGKASRSKEEFEKLVGVNLPLIYLNFISKLQKSVPHEVWACWNVLFDEYCTELQIEYKRDDEKYNYDVNNIMIGRSTIFAEILRSTFFRLVEYFHSQGFIEFSELFDYTLRNFTIEPSVWPIRMSSMPEWWPIINLEINREEKLPDLKLDIEKLLSSPVNHQILTLNAVFSNNENFYHSDYYYQLEILPFAVSRNYTIQCEPSIIFCELERNSGIWYPDIESLSNFGVYSNKLQFIQNSGSSILQSSGIIPLVANVRSSTTNMFQYYRMFHLTKLLTPFIKEKTKLIIKDESLQYLLANKSIATYNEFLDGLRDTTDFRDLLPYNTFLLISNEYLEEFLNNKNLKLQYVVKKTLYKKDRYSNSENMEMNHKYEFI